ncbi:hypothetical protein E1301_Tti013785 [Triplophysa tibetana]|uniref:Uncharacterized protein n=1 Tax=Triplophysa tibetana TaxID=1572043 RepID=A0A5A9P542_9TELE|nr:hypothetical protein E1301_Tti013785 [Triplophysa tibetana]
MASLSPFQTFDAIALTVHKWSSVQKRTQCTNNLWSHSTCLFHNMVAVTGSRVKVFLLKTLVSRTLVETESCQPFKDDEVRVHRESDRNYLAPQAGPSRFAWNNWGKMKARQTRMAKEDVCGRKEEDDVEMENVDAAVIMKE